MTAFSKEQLRQLITARKRPISKKMGKLPDNVLSELREFWAQNSNKNILADMIKTRTEKGLPLEDSAYLSKEYSQVLLQNFLKSTDAANPENFTDPIDQDLVYSIEKSTGQFCKARLSCLLPSGKIAEHIDDPKQTRIIALIEGDHKFSIKGPKGYETIPMKLGELWFVNTAWPHKVINNFPNKRVALMLNYMQPMVY